MGTLFDEVKPCSTDKNEHFRQHTSDLLSYVLSPFIGGVKVRFPFVEEKWSKVHSIAWALAHGVTPEELKASVSCWFHDGLPCGICMQCFRRYINFKLNGLEEQYRHHPLYHKRGKELLRLFLTQTPKNSDEENTVRIIREVTPLLDEPLQKLITDIQNEVV